MPLRSYNTVNIPVVYVYWIVTIYYVIEKPALVAVSTNTPRDHNAPATMGKAKALDDGTIQG